MKSSLLILIVATSLVFSCQDKISNNNSSSKQNEIVNEVDKSLLNKKENEQISKDCYSRGIIAMGSEKTLVQAINEFNCSIRYSEKYKKESIQFLIKIYDRLGDSVQYNKYTLLLNKIDSLNH